KITRLDREPLVDRHVDTPRDTAETGRDGQGGFARDRVRQSEGGRQKLLVRHYAVDETHAERLGRGDRLRGEDHPQRALATDQARRALGAAERRRETEVDLRLAEFGTLTRDGERCGFDDLTPPAMGQSVDGDYDRLRVGLDPARQPLSAP